MKDFLGTEIHEGDFCVYLKNERIGSSTIRKVLKHGIVEGFTSKKVKLEKDTAFPDNVVALGVSSSYTSLSLNILDIDKKHVIVAMFNRERVNLDTAKHIFDNLKEMFPDNDIIMIPDNMSINLLERSELMSLSDRIRKMAEEKL